MKKALRILWLVLLSVFPISTLLADVELDPSAKENKSAH
jgi:hypothetical protein